MIETPEYGKAEYAPAQGQPAGPGGRGRAYTVIIPTLNAAATLRRQLEAVQGQSLPPEAVIVVDSESADGTAGLAASVPGVRVIPVKREEFDHGGTRHMAICASATPFVVLLTQDAMPVDDHWAQALLAPFEDARVAAVCGRQIARPDARPFEKAVRAFRYAGGDRAWDRTDLPGLGVRGYLLSDVCAAYRREAYDAVGGFARPLMTNEDMLIAADLLNAGWRLAYSAGAAVWHSHNHTLRQEYARNRLIGAFLEEYSDRFPRGGETGEGLRLVRRVTRELASQGRTGEMLCFWLNCGARLLGNRAGKGLARRNKSTER